MERFTDKPHKFQTNLYGDWQWSPLTYESVYRASLQEIGFEFLYRILNFKFSVQKAVYPQFILHDDVVQSHVVEYWKARATVTWHGISIAHAITRQGMDDFGDTFANLFLFLLDNVFKDGLIVIQPYNIKSEYSRRFIRRYGAKREIAFSNSHRYVAFRPDFDGTLVSSSGDKKNSIPRQNPGHLYLYSVSHGVMQDGTIYKNSYHTEYANAISDGSLAEPAFFLHLYLPYDPDTGVNPDYLPPGTELPATIN